MYSLFKKEVKRNYIISSIFKKEFLVDDFEIQCQEDKILIFPFPAQQENQD